MATGDRVITPWQRQHELIEAAEEQRWTVLRWDVRMGITLEEPHPQGVTLTVNGGVTPGFIRSLPVARSLEDETVADVRFSRADPNRETLHRGGERS